MHARLTWRLFIYSVVTSIVGSGALEILPSERPAAALAAEPSPGNPEGKKRSNAKLVQQSSSQKSSKTLPAIAEKPAPKRAMAKRSLAPPLKPLIVEMSPIPHKSNANLAYSTKPSTGILRVAAQQQAPAVPGESAPAVPPTTEEIAPVTEPTVSSGLLGETQEAPVSSGLFEAAGIPLGGGNISIPSATSDAPGNPGNSTNVTSSQENFAPTTTGELLNKAPSAATRRTSAINVDTRIRGLNSGQINASADGATQYKTRIDIDSQLSAIDPGIIDPMRGITVIDGPYDSRYGLGYGFLIANLLQSPRSEDGLAGDGSILYQYNTNGRGMYTRETLMGGGEYWGFVFSYGFRQANDYYAGSNNIDFKIPASYNTWNGYLAGGIDLTTNSRLEVSYIRADRNDVELPGVIYDLNSQVDNQFNARYIIQDDKNGPQNFVLQYWHGRTDYNGDSTRESKHRTFYNQFMTNVFLGNTAPFLQPFNVANTFVRGMLEDQGVRSLLTFGETDGPQWTIGGDWRNYQQYYTEEHIAFTGSSDTAAFGDQVFGIPTSAMNDYGLLSHAVLPVADNRIVATIGGRLDFTRAFVGMDAPNSPAANPGLIQNPFAGFGKPNEVLSMVYGTTDFQIIRYEDEYNSGFSVIPGMAYGMRNPTLSELYSSSVFVPLVRSGNGIATGNSELTPERNLQFDLALVHRGTPDSMVRLARLRGFASNIDNYILYAPLGTAGAQGATPFRSVVYQYNNIERATLAGTDLMAEIQLSRYVGLYGSVAYVKGTNHSPLLNTPAGTIPNPILATGSSEALPGIYPLNGVLGLTLSDSEENTPTWGMSLLSRLVRGQEYIATSLFDQRTPGWSSFDLVGFYRFNDNVRLTSSVENIFDFLYTQQGSLALVNQTGNYSLVKDPGVTVRMGLQIDF